MRPLVLLLPKTSYRADDLLAAAGRIGVPVKVASDRCSTLARQWPGGALALDFTRPEAAAAALAASLAGELPLAVVGVDEQTAVIAARAAALLGLPHNPVEAVQAAKDKWAARERLREAGVPGPWCERWPRDLPAAELERRALLVRYPCVLKPRALSGSRGVIRADSPPALVAAFARLGALLRSPQLAVRREPLLGDVLVEGFLPGPEVALEGLLEGGRLEVLAIFDKPDPLDGPFFEETLYVTPSRHPPEVQAAIAEMAGRAARALGLSEGPLHAELRLGAEGPVAVEVAARSIGGLCGRTLRFGVGVSLEELVLRHALARSAGERFTHPAREAAAAGVLMLPTRRRGLLREVRGLDAARAVPGVVEVVITLRPQEELLPLPEGQSYLGFAFARGETPALVEAALRAAWEKLEVLVAPKLALAGSSPAAV